MRYLWNIFLLSLLLTAFLSAAPTKLAFQGYVTADDGKGFTGKITTGIRVYSTADSDVDANKILQKFPGSVQVKEGVYTVELSLEAAEADTLMTYEDIYLAIYLYKGETTEQNVFMDVNRLKPRVHMLGVPIALKARGVNVKNNGGLLIGSSGSSPHANGILATGDQTGGWIGIGTSNPSQPLHVSANGSTPVALKVPTIKGTSSGTNGTTITATRVLNVKWE
jgi:hypothetical protein